MGPYNCAFYGIKAKPNSSFKGLEKKGGVAGKRSDLMEQEKMIGR